MPWCMVSFCFLNHLIKSLRIFIIMLICGKYPNPLPAKRVVLSASSFSNRLACSLLWDIQEEFQEHSTIITKLTLKAQNTFQLFPKALMLLFTVYAENRDFLIPAAVKNRNFTLCRQFPANNDIRMDNAFQPRPLHPSHILQNRADQGLRSFSQSM